MLRLSHIALLNSCSELSTHNRRLSRLLKPDYFILDFVTPTLSDERAFATSNN